MCDINNHIKLTRLVVCAELKLGNLKDVNYTDSQLEEAAVFAVSVLGNNATEEEKVYLKQAVIRELESRHSTILTGGVMLLGRDSRSWLTLERKEALLKHNFWAAYKAYKEADLGQATADRIDEETDEILGYMADPEIMNPQRKMGLVIGDVQSGKTANYAGLICKAADAGYKVIIVIAGIIRSLRNQTQERLERDFVGRSSRPDRTAGGCYGVSCHWTAERKPAFPVHLLTQYTHDFDTSDARQARPDFEHDSIALLVIKKNSNILRNVYEYFSTRLNQTQRGRLPLLLLDDEADNATPNVGADEKPTTINHHIRKLLSLFPRHSYVGYTATPYANIFINPFVDEEASDDDIAKQDLFPKDFIMCLSRSNKYIGATRLFDPENDSSDSSNELEFNVCTIDEEPEYVEELKKGRDPGMIPNSMKEAINTFVLTKAMRLIRDGYDRHCTMMIHVTMRQLGHEIIRNHVRAYWRQLQEAINSYIALSEPEHHDDMIKALKQTWDDQFERTNVTGTWKDVCAEMAKNDFTEKFMVLMENANVRRDDAAPYSEDLRLVYHDNEPLTAIVVGGNSLARGLTLEGLCTSYFLRDSKQYDTLMQMGRWFGYRGNYADICRIFLTERMQANFAEIALATEELKASVAIMKSDGKSPMEFGLRVRNSVGGLLITSRNKMRSAEQREEWVDFSDNLLETYRIPSAPELVESNRRVMCDFIRELDAKFSRYNSADHAAEKHYGIIWEKVPGTMVADYLGRFSDMSFSADRYVLGTLMEHLKKGKLESLDVVLIAGDDVKSSNTTEINGEEYRVPYRVPNVVDGYYFFAKNHPFAKNHETGHVEKEEVKRLCNLYMTEHPERNREDVISGSELPGRYFRRAKGRRPLMMLALMTVPEPEVALEILAERARNRHKAEQEAEAPAESQRCTRTVAVYGFSFPQGARSLQKVKYTVNQVELKRLREEQERMEMAAADGEEE